MKRVSQRVGLSIRNQASGGEIEGPQPLRWCLPYGAVRNWQDMKVNGLMRKRDMREVLNRDSSEKAMGFFWVVVYM